MSDTAIVDLEATELARALVAIPSVNPMLEAGGSGEAEVMSAAAAWLASAGFQVSIEHASPGRPNVIARHTGDVPGRTLLFNGHLDTVGVEGMTIPPFGGELIRGRLWGRGSCDMKGGVASLMAAAAALVRAGHPGTVVVALTADEEHASLGMQHLVARGIAADAAVVCEPTELKVMPAHKGFIWLRALFRGRAAHGSRPDLGVDAVRHAALYVAALDDLARRYRERPTHLLLGQPSFHVGTITGGSAASVYPETCDLVLERRTIPGEVDAEVVREFEDVLQELRDSDRTVDATLEVTMARPGTEVGRGTPLVKGLLAAAFDEGIEPKVEGMTAWVDGALLNEAGIPAVCFGPGSILQAHTADEWIETAQIEKCARALERFATRFLAGKLDD
jgi:acetylornithine deacetylase